MFSYFCDWVVSMKWSTLVNALIENPSHLSIVLADIFPRFFSRLFRILAHAQDVITAVLADTGLVVCFKPCARINMDLSANHRTVYTEGQL